MTTTDFETFKHALDKSLNEALRQGVDAERLEMVLQKRAQDMREYAEQQD